MNGRERGEGRNIMITNIRLMDEREEKARARIAIVNGRDRKRSMRGSVGIINYREEAGWKGRAATISWRC